MIFSNIKRSKKNHLAKSISGAFLLKICLVGLSFITTLIVARVLGPTDYGVYVYTMSWLILLRIPSQLGLNTILIREISSNEAHQEWGLIQGLLKWTNLLTFFASVVVTSMALLFIYIQRESLGYQMAMALTITMLSLPLSALSAMRQGAIQGLKHVVLGLLPDQLFQPGLFLILLCLSLLSSSDSQVIPIIIFRTISYGFSFLIGIHLLLKVLPKDARNAEPKFNISKWKYSILPFTLISATHIINARTDFLMLGSMVGTQAVGLYNVASQGASIVTFILVAVNVSIGPRIADLHAQGNNVELQRLVTKSSRLLLLSSLPVAIILVVFGKWFCGFFGAEFIQAYPALLILIIGQFLNAVVGSVGVILDMTGNERDSAIGISISAISNIILNYLLIPRYGILGAAIATSLSLAIWNFILLFKVRQKLGINPTALGFI